MENIHNSNNFNNYNNTENNNIKCVKQYNSQPETNVQADTFQKKENSITSGIMAGTVAAYAIPACLSEIDMSGKYLYKLIDPIAEQIEKIILKRPVAISEKKPVAAIVGAYALIGLIGAAVGGCAGYLYDKISNMSKSNL